MKVTNRLYTLAALTVFSMHVNASQPSCNNMKGTWVNQLGSTLKIKSIDPSTKMLKGTYKSPSGTSGQKFNLIGWINSSEPAPDADNVHVIAFSVQWGQYGSITSWTGICTNNNETPTIKTIWNLVRSNSQFDWDHILTNSDTFTPK
ncbi:hypothetical protein MNBD_GAMMA18-2219 [hydrothermal vent metagenome]|uniref:Avidin n=1 Tax=hydrothermal vent metagenome TaxID=652676 RepID=A0A3B0Z5T6_9ZZZZ